MTAPRRSGRRALRIAARALPRGGVLLPLAARLLAVVGLVALYAGAPARVVGVASHAGALARVTGPVTESVAYSTAGDGKWQLDLLKASKVWKLSTGAGVTVAVIDSGVVDTHPDLAGRVLPGTDLVTGSGDGTNDEVGHGTTVAALIAGRGTQTGGVVGLAPDASILPVRVLDASNSYSSAKTVADGIVWAVDHGARVINLSLGGETVNRMLAEAIDYAFARDVVVVACVGNVIAGGTTQVWHPASEPGVVAVTALSEGGELWRGSLTGPRTVLAAPGYDLAGAKLGGYSRVQGTSFAAPLVSATAALIRGRYPQMTAANVVQRLIRTAQDVGSAGRDDRYGFGIVDPYAALTTQVAEVVTNPLDTTPPPGRSGFGSAEGSPSVPGLSPSTVPRRQQPEMRTVSNSEPPVGLAAALAGIAVLVGGVAMRSSFGSRRRRRAPRRRPGPR